MRDRAGGMKKNPMKGEARDGKRIELKPSSGDCEKSTGSGWKEALLQRKTAL